MTSRWFIWKYWRQGVVSLLFCSSMISGCGIFSTPTTTTTPFSPQPTTITHPFHSTFQTLDGAFAITLAIAPNAAGTNIFNLTVIDRHTQKPATRIKVTLYATMQDMAMGTDSVVLRGIGAGQYNTSSSILNMSGHWALGITIMTSDRIIHRAGVSLVTA